MTIKKEIQTLKILAKRYARANRLPLHKALDAMATELGFAHWSEAAKKAKAGWLPSQEEVSRAKAFARQVHQDGDKKQSFIEASFARPVDEPVRQGKIGDYGFAVFEVFGDIRMEGEGWRILVDEAQFAQPVVEIEKLHSETSPARSREFLDAAVGIADEEAAKVRAGIATDWPRRSTKPDAEGVVAHPLFGDRAASWFCLHCDGEITGSQLAENLWHCPACGAAPIDIFSSPDWLDGDDVKTKPVNVSGTLTRPEPRVEVVDSRPKLNLNEENITLLLRTALLEDAANPSERIGALLAEIYVDEEGDTSIVLDEDLWPEDKDPEAAIAVAKMLGAELDLAVTSMTFPFAWPDLGHVTTSTREYVQMLLDAYADDGVIHRGGDGH